jgi:hypothetical protein
MEPVTWLDRVYLRLVRVPSCIRQLSFISLESPKRARCLNPWATVKRLCQRFIHRTIKTPPWFAWVGFLFQCLHSTRPFSLKLPKRPAPLLASQMNGQRSRSQSIEKRSTMSRGKTRDHFRRFPGYDKLGQ